jgi:hypothetical protein
MIMGTNFYVKRKLKTEDEVNGMKYLQNGDYAELKDLMDEKMKPVHIGKSSCGWQFLFNWNLGKYYDANRQSIKEYLEKSDGLYDEYGEPMDLDEFWKMVDSKKDLLNGKKAYEAADENERASMIMWGDYCDKIYEQFNPEFHDFESDGLRFATSDYFS